MLSQACTQADRWGQIIHEAGHPSDHPIPIGFMEGRYLKFVALKIAPYV
jgi:SAM-dependent methyltransferase (EC 2.1.1.-)